MRYPDWVRMPSNWILDDGLRALLWKQDEHGSPAHKVAALRCYIVIAMHLETRRKKKKRNPHSYLLIQVEHNGWEVEEYVAIISYTKLAEMAGISRASVAGGLDILERLGIITRTKEGRDNVYSIRDFNGRSGWCKLPCRALLTRDGEQLEPFRKRPLRSKIELYALKLFLYLCAVRDNYSLFVVASFEKINEGTSIPEKEIPGAWAYLIGVGLLSHVGKTDPDAGESNYANKYYLKGYKSLVNQHQANS